MAIPDETKAASVRLGSQAGLLLAGSAFTIVVGLPLQVYVARVLGASDLGIFSLLDGGVGLLTGLLGLGVAPAFVRFIPQHLEEKKFSHIRRLLRHGLLLLATVGLTAVAAVALVLPVLRESFGSLQGHETTVLLMSLLVPLSLVLYGFQQGLRGFQEILHMVVGSSFLQLAVKTILVLLVFWVGLRLKGYVLAVLLSVAVGAVWMAIGLRKQVTSMPSGTDTLEGESGQAKRWRRYATVMYGSSLIGLGAGYLDRFLIGFFAGTSAVGVLAIVKQLQQLPVMFLNMLLTAVAPMFSAATSRGDKDERQHLFSLTTDWVLRASLPLFLFFVLFSDPLLRLYGEEFVELGVRPLWILVGAQFVNLACGPVGNLMNMSGLETAMLRLNVAQTIVTVLALALLVPGYGLIGGALSLALGVLLHNLIALVIVKRELKIVWWNSRFRLWIAPLLITGLAGFGSLRWMPEPGVVGLALNLIGLYLLFHLVSLSQGLHADDREFLQYLLASVRPRKSG